MLIVADLTCPADDQRSFAACAPDGCTPACTPPNRSFTLGNDDQLTALHAYDAGSDHHLPDTSGYVLLRAVLQTVARRAYPPAKHRSTG